MSNVTTLIRFIEHHGIRVLSHNGQSITVETVYCKDGQSYTEVEIVPATLAAVRAYLGY